MSKIINEKGETLIIVDDETFEITESNDPAFEIIWNGWLEDGIPTIGMPGTEQPLIQGAVEDTELIYFPGDEGTEVLLEVELLGLGLEFVE